MLNKFLVSFIVLLTFIQIPLAFAIDQPAKRPPIIPPGAVDEKGEGFLLPHIADTGKEEVFITETLLPNMTKNFIAFAGAAALLFLIIGAIQLLTAYGNDEKIATGKKTITYAIVGLVIALLSYAIVSIISSVQIVPPPAPPGPPTTAPATQPGPAPLPTPAEAPPIIPK